jgi:hypothetical protein
MVYGLSICAFNPYLTIECTHILYAQQAGLKHKNHSDNEFIVNQVGYIPRSLLLMAHSKMKGSKYPAACGGGALFQVRKKH